MKLVTFLLLLGLPAFAQQQANLTPFQPIKVRTTPWHELPALLYLPDENVTGKKYPLIICLHGRSIAGKDLSKIFREGVTKQMHAGKKIDAINKVDGKKYKFIVLAPLAESWSLGPEHLESVLDDVVKRYPIDRSRVYITGYSAGGWSVGMAVTHPSLARKIAAAINMSPATIDEKNLKSFKVAADANVHTWYFGGKEEPVFLGNSRLYADSTNKYKQGLSKLTVGDHGHCCWSQYFNPAWRENGFSIYEWLLQYSKPALLK
ncbi:prolyl oligopeptidase family serine peptidase [Chitinophaga sp. XS-30]|uniref:carboxylesterase family protein n=1 Tax=Chitinophaga sp. XS-30 TaxID=2604421 RepID=UPI0011DE16AB|nr:prolyl oligopeptidase family serine peptidase [Chitinophaga sp. XS-30]QEH42598.1 prolyl oligopeptidase family serine peptidase [Chitinophaga sp. XS-30]